jgi:hypothetical protein
MVGAHHQCDQEQGAEGLSGKGSTGWGRCH